MKMILLILTVIFGLLTFLGAGYVLINQGRVNAGYACVPMILCVSCASILRVYGKNEK